VPALLGVRGTGWRGFAQKGPPGQGPFRKKVGESGSPRGNGRFGGANLSFEGENVRGRETEDMF